MNELGQKVLLKAQEKEPKITMDDVELLTTGAWCDYCDNRDDCTWGKGDVWLKCAVKQTVENYLRRLKKNE